MPNRSYSPLGRHDPEINAIGNLLPDLLRRASVNPAAAPSACRVRESCGSCGSRCYLKPSERRRKAREQSIKRARKLARKRTEKRGCCRPVETPSRHASRCHSNRRPHCFFINPGGRRMSPAPPLPSPAHRKSSGSSISRGLPASPQYPRTLRPSSSGTHLHALHPLPQQRKYLALASQCRRGKKVR